MLSALHGRGGSAAVAYAIVPFVLYCTVFQPIFNSIYDDESSYYECNMY